MLVEEAIRNYHSGVALPNDLVEQLKDLASKRNKALDACLIDVVVDYFGKYSNSEESVKSTGSEKSADSATRRTRGKVEITKT
jgi:hypothetical protein